jgi:hypothetical protein
MPTTSNIGLHIYNDQELSSAFSTVRDWRKGFQGNNSPGNDSDMQIIDAAFGSVFSNILSLSSDLSSAISSIENKQNKLLVFSNVVASNWVADNTYSNYPYKCDLSLSGILSTTVVDVIFNLEDATSGDYAPICATLDGIVTIYGKVSAAITIPTIKEV